MNADTATKIVLLKLLKDTVAELDRQVRADADLDRGDRKAAIIGGERVGYVTMTDPKPGWRVADGEAFRAWVRETHPSELYTVEAVRASFEKAILAQPITATGEVPPGLEWSAGNPHVTVTAVKGAADTLRGYLDREGLTLAELVDSLTTRQVTA